LWGAVGVSVVILALYLTLVSRLSPFGAHGHYFQSDEGEAANLRLERRRSSAVAGMNARNTITSTEHSYMSGLGRKQTAAEIVSLCGPDM